MLVLGSLPWNKKRENKDKKKSKEKSKKRR
jgi:hypothetical protein